MSCILASLDACSPGRLDFARRPGEHASSEAKMAVTTVIMKGYMYILRCANGQYYTGSTKYLQRRLAQHQQGEGANFTKKHLPVELVYYEEYNRIDTAFYREKQVQAWSSKKKEALIKGDFNRLHELAECQNETHCSNIVVSASLDDRPTLHYLTPPDEHSSPDNQIPPDPPDHFDSTHQEECGS